MGEGDGNWGTLCKSRFTVMITRAAFGVFTDRVFNSKNCYVVSCEAVKIPLTPSTENNRSKS